jgi:hypothetical protein
MFDDPASTKVLIASDRLLFRSTLAEALESRRWRLWARRGDRGPRRGRARAHQRTDSLPPLRRGGQKEVVGPERGTLQGGAELEPTTVSMSSWPVLSAVTPSFRARPKELRAANVRIRHSKDSGS